MSQQTPPPYGNQPPQGGQPPYGGQPPHPNAPQGGYPNPNAKSQLVAGLLGIFLGGFGVHRFYLGYTSIGVWQIVVTFVTCGIGAWWGIIEGILYLASSDPKWSTDAQGVPLAKN